MSRRETVIRLAAVVALGLGLTAVGTADDKKLPAKNVPVRATVLEVRGDRIRAECETGNHWDMIPRRIVLPGKPNATLDDLRALVKQRGKVEATIVWNGEMEGGCLKLDRLEVAGR